MTIQPAMEPRTVLLQKLRRIQTNFRRRQLPVFLCLLAIACIASAGCRIESADAPTTIQIDGSSTVLPISQAVAQAFMKTHKEKVVVGSSGTGGGFTKFAAGETDINDASRPIKPGEKDACAKNGIEPVELKIAIDGLTVVVNKDNNWCDHLTVEQLKKVWEPNSAVKKWSDLNPAWPAEKIQLYGADTASGTFDYFTEVICGKPGASRTDYIASANDNELVRGVSGDKHALGYFGYAYYVENKDKLKSLGIAANDKPEAPVFPTDQTIEAGTYVPLSRPLFIYVSKKSLQRPEVKAFAEFYLNEGQPLVHERGYIRLKEDVLNETKKALKASAG